jgi:hypothetical protein
MFDILQVRAVFLIRRVSQCAMPDPDRLGDGVIDELASDQLRERRSLTEASNMAAVAERGTGEMAMACSLAEEENNGERGACMHA